jgi:hypothetical protein
MKKWAKYLNRAFSKEEVQIKCVHMHVNAKIIPAETISGIGG